MEKLPPLQPCARSFLEGFARAPPLEKLAPAEARAAVVAAQSASVAAPPADVQRALIAGVPCYVYRPAGVTQQLPAAIYLHGGGWVLCDHRTHDRLMRELADRSGAAIVFVEYERSPEVHYPFALEQAYAALRELSRRGPAFGIDGARLAVAGDSSGANLATALAMRAARKGPPLRLQLLFFPVTDAAMDTPSYREFAEGYFLTRAQMEWFWDAYAPDPRLRGESTASPLRATLEELRGMAEALVITADHDVLRDEGEAYAAKLAAAGVRAQVTRYPGTIHAFVVLNALAGDPSPRQAIDDAASALRRALQPERAGSDGVRREL